MSKKPIFWLILTGVFLTIGAALRTPTETSPVLLPVRHAPNFPEIAWVVTLPVAKAWFDTGIPLPCYYHMYVQPTKFSATVNFSVRLGSRVQNAGFWVESPQKQTMRIQDSAEYRQCSVAEREQLHTIQLKVKDKGDLQTLEFLVHALPQELFENEIARLGAAKTEYIRTRDIVRMKMEEFKKRMLIE